MMKRLSIVIVTYNSEKDIYDCLKSIWNNCDIPKDQLEICIVDNSLESDSMFRKLEYLYGQDIMLIHNSHNGGYGQGNNVGIRKASSPIILIMNPDVRIIEPIFDKVLRAFEEDKNLGMYGMKQMLTPTLASTNSFACTTMMSGYISTPLIAICTRFEKYIQRYMYIQGSCFFVRKDVIKSAGLFDEENFMYGEEDDLHFRIREKTRSKIVYNHSLHYLHLTKDRIPDIKYQKKRLQSSLFLNEKKGYKKEKTIRNFLQNTRLLIIRERIRLLFNRGNKDLYRLNTEFYKNQKQLLRNEEKK